MATRTTGLAGGLLPGIANRRSRRARSIAPAARDENEHYHRNRHEDPEHDQQVIRKPTAVPFTRNTNSMELTTTERSPIGT